VDNNRNILKEWIEDWGKILKEQDSRRRNFYSSIQLWNVKHYYGNAEEYDNKSLYRVVNRDECEVPLERKLFYKSKDGRFAPPEVPISYWSFTYLTAKVEATDELKNKGYSLKESIKYYRKNQFTHEIQRFLKYDIPILDLANKKRKIPFIDLIKKYNIYKEQLFIDEIVDGTDSSVYPATQAIAQKAFENGFKGIIWESSRYPNDVILCGNISLVVFSEDGLMNQKDKLVVEE
jgi:RES domain